MLRVLTLAAHRLPSASSGARKAFASSASAASHKPHAAPGTHTLDPMGTKEEDDALGPESGALVGDPADPNIWAEGISPGQKRADAYARTDDKEWHAATVDTPGGMPAIELGKSKILTAKEDLPEPSPPGEPGSVRPPPEMLERATAALGHVEYTNVLGSPENIRANNNQGKTGGEIGEEMHTKGP